MEKYKYDEKNGLWYELQGDYYLPCLKTTGGRTTVYRYMGTATFALHQTTPQGALRQFADKRQT